MCDFYVGDQSTTRQHSEKPSCSGSARASKGQPVKTWSSVLGDEMPTASSSHDGVKGAVFPEFGARAPCGFQKIDNAAPHGGAMALPSQPIVKICAATLTFSWMHRTRSRFLAQAEHVPTLI